MIPFKLITSSTLKANFFRLARMLTYVPDWDDQRIGPNMMRAFSQVLPAQEALREYHQSITRQMNNNSELFRIAQSRDTQCLCGDN